MTVIERTLEQALSHAEEARQFKPEDLRDTSRDLIVLADEVLRLQKGFKLSNQSTSARVEIDLNGNATVMDADQGGTSV